MNKTLHDLLAFGTTVVAIGFVVGVIRAVAIGVGHLLGIG